MPHSVREVKESDLRQGVDEKIPYDITTTPWVSGPSTPTVVVKDVDNDFADVTTTLLPTNSPAAAGDVITLDPLQAGTQDTRYRIEVKWVVGVATYETWFEVVFEL